MLHHLKEDEGIVFHGQQQTGAIDLSRIFRGQTFDPSLERVQSGLEPLSSQGAKGLIC
jgi:hypothetical protein